MQVFIVKDGGATKIPREVADQAEVDTLRAAGWEVEVPQAEVEVADEEVPADDAPKAKAKKAKA